jgi:hypothetical protein
MNTTGKPINIILVLFVCCFVWVVLGYWGLNLVLLHMFGKCFYQLCLQPILNFSRLKSLANFAQTGLELTIPVSISGVAGITAVCHLTWLRHTGLNKNNRDYPWLFQPALMIACHSRFTALTFRIPLGESIF